MRTMKISLIGLGVNAGDLTVRAREALSRAGEIIARTSRSESFKGLDGFEVRTLDRLFETSRNFDTLNKKLAAEVLSAAKEKDVCYCVDGAVCEDEACAIILAKRRDCEVYEGVSKAAHAINLSKTKRGNITCLSAYGIGGVKSCRAAVVYDIDCDYIAGVAKEKLSYIFGEESDCTFVRGESAARIKLYELDRQKDYDMTCAVVVEEREFLKKERYDYADLEDMVRLLRAPGGCPWDRVQTAESIKGNVVEEAYELADAIERGDYDGIEEETGDILLQAAFHSVMAAEKGEFTGGDALTRVVKKLISRHSHIFGGDKAASEGEALGVWEKNKREEKNQQTIGETVLSVPKNFPSCMRAQKIGKRAAKSGMDFLSPVSASEKLWEEVHELLDALIAGDRDAVFDEAGDLLFAAVNTCRLADVDCEEALRAACDKFVKRFVKFEELIIADGKEVTSLIDAEYDYYWLQAKRALEKC